MPDDALDRVLRLIAEGRLTAAEAAPILDALESRPEADGAGPTARDEVTTERPGAPGKVLRVQVTEDGRAVINLRIPLSLGRAAISQVPGLSESTSDRIREAIEAGVKGSILEVDDAGDGVRISIE
jgi:hypothetical protein